jgi:hypothetical protein
MIEVKLFSPAQDNEACLNNVLSNGMTPLDQKGKVEGNISDIKG